MDNIRNDAKQLDISQKEILLMRLSQHIEQSQVDSPAYSLSNLAQNGTEEFVSEFLSDQPFLDTSTLENFMQSQLYVSSFWGLHDIVKILLENKADPNFKNHKTHWTPLHAASFQDHGRVIMLLLEYGADPTSPDYKGRTPADFASVSDKIWSHFDIIGVKRATSSELAKQGLLRKTDEKMPDMQDRTKSGIKLAEYSNTSSNSASAKPGTTTRTGYTDSLSRTSRELSNGYRSSLSESEYNSTLPLRSGTAISPVSTSRSSSSLQMKEILGGTTSVEYPLSGGRGRGLSSTRNSSAVSSILTWE